MDEKRRYYRIKDSKIAVLYKAMDSDVEHTVSILDISGGGMRLPIEGRLKPGTILEISIQLPGENLPFLGVAKVIWQEAKITKTKEGQDYYETGIEFIRLGIQNRKCLVRYINAKVLNK